jgi:hypothetical protein
MHNLRQFRPNLLISNNAHFAILISAPQNLSPSSHSFSIQLSRKLIEKIAALFNLWLPLSLALHQNGVYIEYFVGTGHLLIHIHTYTYNIGKCSAQRAAPILLCCALSLSCRLAMQIMCSDAALFVGERRVYRGFALCSLSLSACTLQGIKCWGRREHDLISEALIVKFVGRSDAAAASHTLPSQNCMTSDPRLAHQNISIPKAVCHAIYRFF